jgi:hypothetical protein
MDDNATGDMEGDVWSQSHNATELAVSTWRCLVLKVQNVAYCKLFLVCGNGVPLHRFEGVPLGFQLHLLLPGGAEQGVLEGTRPLTRDLPGSP